MFRAMESWPKSFRDAFCEHDQCAPEEYVRRATRIALPWRVRLLRPLIQLLSPDYFQPDYEFLELAGHARSWRDLHAAIGTFQSNNRLRGGFYRNRLKFRASGRRVTRLTEQLFPADSPG